MRSPTACLLALVMAAVSGGCDPVATCEEYGDMLDSPGGLALEESEHPAGWGSDRCAQCHPSWTYHQVNCTSLEDIDLQEMWLVVDPEQTGSCVECHGENGVVP